MKQVVIKVKIFILIFSIFATGSLFSASLNFRQEFSPDYNSNGDNDNRTRIYFSHRFSNGTGIAIETKWRDQDDGLAFTSYSSNGSEVQINYLWKVTDKFSVTPAFNADAADSDITYKLDVRGAYSFASNFSSSLRYRVRRQRTQENIVKDDRWQINWVSYYKITTNVRLGMDAEYTKYIDSGSDLDSGNKTNGWKGKDADHLINFMAEYQKFDYIPFFEFAFITKKSSDSDIKDTYYNRYRFGIKFNI